MRAIAVVLVPLAALGCRATTARASRSAVSSRRPPPPADAYVEARYRNGGFWSDDRDAQSKVVLNFLMLLFSLTETGAPQVGAPVVTIPAR